MYSCPQHMNSNHFATATLRESSLHPFVILKSMAQTCVYCIYYVYGDVSGHYLPKT
jgi:hypothetical protein